MSLELLLLMHPGMLLACSAAIMFLQLMLSFLATRSQVVFWKSFCRQSTSNIQFLCGVGPPQWQDFTLLLVKLRQVLVSLVIKQNLVYGSAENCGSRLSTPHRFCGKTWKNIITREAVSPLPPYITEPSLNYMGAVVSALPMTGFCQASADSFSTYF